MWVWLNAVHQQIWLNYKKITNLKLTEIKLVGDDSIDVTVRSLMTPRVWKISAKVGLKMVNDYRSMVNGRYISVQNQLSGISKGNDHQSPWITMKSPFLACFNPSQSPFFMVFITIFYLWTPLNSHLGSLLLLLAGFQKTPAVLKREQTGAVGASMYPLLKNG